MTATINEPDILTANSKCWRPGSSASGRRRNEERNQAAVADYLCSLGFTVTRSGDYVSGTLVNSNGDVTIEVAFSYRESCKNVYKRLHVTRNGKRSNVAALRKLTT